MEQQKFAKAMFSTLTDSLKMYNQFSKPTLDFDELIKLLKTEDNKAFIEFQKEEKRKSVMKSCVHEWSFVDVVGQEHCHKCNNWNN